MKVNGLDDAYTTVHPLPFQLEKAKLAGHLFPFFPIKNADSAELAVVSWMDTNLAGAYSVYGL